MITAKHPSFHIHSLLPTLSPSRLTNSSNDIYVSFTQSYYKRREAIFIFRFSVNPDVPLQHYNDRAMASSCRPC